MSAASVATGEFVESRCTLPIHLHPSRLGNVREGVEEQINAMCMKYVDTLGGVLLSYSDLSLLEDKSRNPLSCGTIFQERSYIHFQVELKALSWRCALGERYSGVINAVASDHLSILLHGIFTATIPLSGASIPKGWRWEAERERWVDDNVYTGEEDAAATKEEDAAVKDEDASDDDAAAAPAPGKKLTKKELKKLERRKLRAVMLAATGRTGGGAGGAAAIKPPAAGVIIRGVHVRFECYAIQHTEEYIKLTGTLVPPRPAATTKKHNDASSSLPLGLTGGFTALAPLEGLRNNNAREAETAAGMEDVAEEPFLDLDAIAAVTAPMPGVKTNATAAAAAARPAAAAPAAAPAVSKKPLTAAQQERMEKKKAKLAERMATKAAGATATTAAADSDDDDAAPVATQATPAKKQRVEPAAAATPAPVTAEKKKRKGAEDGAATAAEASGKKHAHDSKSEKKKKLKTES